MKYKLSFGIIIIFSFSVFAQMAKLDETKELKPLIQKIVQLQSENNKLKSEISSINSKVATVNQKLETLDQKVQSNASDIKKTNSELKGRIANSETTTNQKFTQVDNSLSKNSLWSIIGILGAIIVSGLVYWLVSKRQTNDKTIVEAQISKTKKTLEEEGIKLDTKLTEVLETQLKLVQEERAKVPANKSDEVDHSLALKVADEIVRINKNLSNMDANTKGLKQLSASVKRIEDNFAANGYDMPELLNKPFDPRMKMIANMVEDENLEKGIEIITKIIKPQVNYKGVQIQSAQVEVSVGQ
ncbi:hypothetical protein KBJ98_13595 [Flavobacterium sp. F-328]|uniref:Septum formation initiator n=1 Tax=Flavobacterium erciyesense TaxID=2825842 RepID=A0ABS5D6T7_9FLAO|nr:hypothetical protein [Flavobacterium erciyesense]MBQ0909742.1 hypothetical protein [Flavobacterium erciyesense]